MAIVFRETKQRPDVQCAWCKRVCWYREYSSVPQAWRPAPPGDLGEISHGICPECLAAWREQFGMNGRTATAARPASPAAPQGPLGRSFASPPPAPISDDPDGSFGENGMSPPPPAGLDDLGWLDGRMVEESEE